VLVTATTPREHLERAAKATFARAVRGRVRSGVLATRGRTHGRGARRFAPPTLDAAEGIAKGASVS